MISVLNYNNNNKNNNNTLSISDYNSLIDYHNYLSSKIIFAHNKIGFPYNDLKN